VTVRLDGEVKVRSLVSPASDSRCTDMSVLDWNDKRLKMLELRAMSRIQTLNGREYRSQKQGSRHVF
jgi:hypothetical protein